MQISAIAAAGPQGLTQVCAREHGSRCNVEADSGSGSSSSSSSSRGGGGQWLRRTVMSNRSAFVIAWTERAPRHRQQRCGRWCGGGKRGQSSARRGEAGRQGEGRTSKMAVTSAPRAAAAPPSGARIANTSSAVNTLPNIFT